MMTPNQQSVSDSSLILFYHPIVSLNHKMVCGSKPLKQNPYLQFVQ